MSDVDSFLFARLADFRIDIEALRQHYLTLVRPVEPTPYHDNGSSYVGWSMTSRDGAIDDGVKQIKPAKNSMRGVTPTPLCVGVVRDALDQVAAKGLTHYRARIMRLENEGREMRFHRDAKNVAWRLHIPLISNPDCFFEWQLDNGEIRRVHLPADGSAWLVRVDVTHRAVNESPDPCERVHLLMSLDSVNDTSLLDHPRIELDEAYSPSVRTVGEIEGEESVPEVPPTWDTLQVTDRLALLEYLPKNGVVAEVGVAKGAFSERIMQITEPQRLHLIDPWVHQDLPLWTKRNDAYHFESNRRVQQRLASQILDRRVILHQGFSLDILPLFPEEYFDWIYLDGDHRFETVRAELELCASRVKKNGLILGHDFIKPEFYPPEHHDRLGVVPAVREFCDERNWELVFQTPDQPRGSKQCPTFVLRRSGDQIEPSRPFVSAEPAFNT